MNAPLRRGLCALVLGGLSLATLPAQASIFQPIAGQTVEELSSSLSITVVDPDTGLSVTFDNFVDQSTGASGVNAFDSVTVIAGIFVPTGELGLSFVINGLIAQDAESFRPSFDYDVTVAGGFIDSAGLYLDGTSVDGDDGETGVEATFGTGTNGAGFIAGLFVSQTDSSFDFSDTTTFSPVSTLVSSVDLESAAGFDSTAHLSAFIQTYGFTTVIPEPSTVAAGFGLLALTLALFSRRLRRKS